MFTNDQIETPSNSTMKTERFCLERIRKATCNLPLLLYQCLQCSVLADWSLLLPDTITTTETVFHTISKLAKFVSKDGVQAKHPANLFSTINRILSLTRDKTSPLPIEMQL